MCGICGIIDYRGNQVSRGVLERMCSQMKHRGPDDEGVAIFNGEPSVGLGHRRLSIIDLSSSGHQPIANEDKSVWVLCNGEIYNYHELRQELEVKGHIFSSQTDIEVIAHLYEEYEEEYIGRLRGMFAIAIWDNNKKRLLLARDRVGKKPLLYYYNNGKFCFASEFSALLSCGYIPKRINYAALENYLTCGYIPAPLTIYEDVFKLEPANFLELKNDKIAINNYWQLNYANKINISEQDAVQELLRLLKEAVSIRLYSDVPLGAFLSGGIDSSIVVALMSELSGKKVNTFSIGFDDADYDELKYARNISTKYNTNHSEFIVKPNALEILPLLVERYGEPFADSSCVPSYYVARQTKRFVTVALNGDGGDESFAGYERYQAMFMADLLQKSPAVIRGLIAGAVAMVPSSPNSKSLLKRTQRFMSAASLPFAKRYLRWVSIFTSDLKKELYSEDFGRRISNLDGANFIEKYLYKFSNYSMLDCLLNADVHTYLPNDLLVKMDIASMANSLEARSPFLDHKLMEFASRLPAEYKMRGLIKKYILKKTIKDFVPKENIYRRKMGFGIPIGSWFRNELKGFVKETLLCDRSLNRGYFKADNLKNMIKLHIEKKADYTFPIWSLLMLELWHKRFMD